MTIDEHPLRYARETQIIEAILFRRALQKKLDGYVLEAALEIALALKNASQPA
jgi:hypothetical protein